MITFPNINPHYGVNYVHRYEGFIYLFIYLFIHFISQYKNFMNNMKKILDKTRLQV